MLSTIFCAVPAFIRVDPAITSGPTRGAMLIAAIRASGDLGFDVTPTVNARRRRAWASAPTT